MSNIKVPEGALKLQGKKYRWLGQWEKERCWRCGAMIDVLDEQVLWFKRWEKRAWVTIGCGHCIIRSGRHVGYVRPEYLNKETKS